MFQKPRVSRHVDDLEGCLRLAIEEIQHGRFRPESAGISATGISRPSSAMVQ